MRKEACSPPVSISVLFFSAERKKKNDGPEFSDEIFASDWSKGLTFWLTRGLMEEKVLQDHGWRKKSSSRVIVRTTRTSWSPVCCVF